MNDPNPVPPPHQPSNSTLATAGLGLPIGIVLVYIINQVMRHNGLEDLPVEVASAIGTIAGALIGLPFAGGRKADTV